MAVVNKQSMGGGNPQKKRGPLVRVEISPGRFVKMYQEDAVIAGHILPPVGAKALPAQENKMRVAGEDKAALPSLPASLPEGERGLQEEADFTIIPGVGQATARALKARGIHTFEQLRAAGQLSFISGATMQAIEKWRGSGG